MEVYKRKHGESIYGIYLTFRHTRNILKNGFFCPWIKDLFGDDVKFQGCEYGNNYPTIRIHISSFEKSKNKIPAKNLIKIRGFFSTVEQLSLGIRNFSNDIRQP